jgi:hypothetical protein
MNGWIYDASSGKKSHNSFPYYCQYVSIVRVLN